MRGERIVDLDLRRVAISGEGTQGSVLVPETYNVLINPLHPDSRAVIAVKIRKWLYDPRLRR